MANYRTIIGIDEAGLGPILGPLTIGYAGFHLPAPLTRSELMQLDMWEPLGVTREPAQRKRRPVVCDSKKLYTPAKGLHALEEEILGWIAAAGHSCNDYVALRGGLCACARANPDDYAWYAAPPARFPIEASPERAALRANRLQAALKTAGYALAELGVYPMLEEELNALMRSLGNKARAEFEGISRILGPLWERHRHMAVVCDRQGGRTRYAFSLRRAFPEAQVEILHESKKVCTYELSIPEVAGVPRMFIAFIEKGDAAHLPIALASMAAKYLRELFMHQFNAWFHNYDANLKPTAGYYKDGRRWLDDTVELRQKIGIDDRRLIRER